MQAFLLALLSMLKEFATSKKVLVAVITAIALAVTKDPALQTKFIELGGILLAAMGITDHGKAAAQIKADAPSAPENVQLNVGS